MTKARHPEIPWEKVAGIGNVLRHNYGRIAAPSIVDKLIRPSGKFCREELAKGAAATARLMRSPRPRPSRSLPDDLIGGGKVRMQHDESPNL